MNANEVRINWQSIRKDLGNMICWIDSQINKLAVKEKQLENLENENYIRGARAMRDAAFSIAAPSKLGGMTGKDLDKYFESDALSIHDVFYKYGALDIIKRVNQWRADKEAEEAEETVKTDDIQVGDEVEVNFGPYGINGIVTKLDGEYANVAEPNLYGIGVNVVCHRKNALKKTGQHFDSIPFDYGVKQSDECY